MGLGLSFGGFVLLAAAVAAAAVAAGGHCSDWPEGAQPREGAAPRVVSPAWALGAGCRHLQRLCCAVRLGHAGAGAVGAAVVAQGLG